MKLTVTIICLAFFALSFCQVSYSKDLTFQTEKDFKWYLKKHQLCAFECTASKPYTLPDGKVCVDEPFNFLKQNVADNPSVYRIKGDKSTYITRHVVKYSRKRVVKGCWMAYWEEYPGRIVVWGNGSAWGDLEQSLIGYIKDYGYDERRLCWITQKKDYKYMGEQPHP